MLTMSRCGQVVSLPHPHVKGVGEAQARGGLEEQGRGHHLVPVRLPSHSGTLLAQGIQTCKSLQQV